MRLFIMRNRAALPALLLFGLSFVFLHGHVESNQQPEDTAASTEEREERSLFETGERLRRIPLPRIGSVTPGSGVAVGLGYTLRDMGRLPLDLDTGFLFSVRGYEHYHFRFGRLGDRRRLFTLDPPTEPLAQQFDTARIKEPGFSLHLDLQYRHYPSQNFFGIGPDSRREDRSDFLLRGPSYEAVLKYQFHPWVGLSARSGLLNFSLGPGRHWRIPTVHQLFDPAQVPGLTDVPDILHFTSGLLVDYRDEPGNPSRGGMFGLLFSRFADRDGAHFRFNRFSFDTRHIVPIGSERRRLAFRVHLSSDQSDSGSQVPFFLMSRLGGGDALRGFPDFRFMDENVLFLSSEYRWDPHRFVELAVFADAGRVFPRLRDLGLSGLQSSYGLGVRFKTPTFVLFRVDLARSREETRLVLTTGPAF